MPADIDELFDALSRQADAIPLAGVAEAQARGRRRTHRRATASVLTAVLLVAAGFGYAFRHNEVRRADQPADKGTIPYVSAPIGLDGRGYGGALAKDGDRAYAVWMRDGSTWMVAADLRTGAVAWPIRAIADSQRAVDQIVATPAAVLVVTRAHSGGRELFAYAPATGAQLWRKNVPDGDQLLYPDRFLVQLSASDGRVIGYDLGSGARRWSERADAVRMLPVSTPADQERIDWSGMPATFTSGLIVVITSHGRAEERDAATGRLRSSRSVQPGSGTTMIASDGLLISHDEADDSAGPVRLRVSGLQGDFMSSKITASLPGRFVTMALCGTLPLVCVVTRQGSTGTTVTAIMPNAVGGSYWKTTFQREVRHVSTARGRLILSDGPTFPGHMLDENGVPQFRSAHSVMWLDAGTFAVQQPDGRLIRYPGGRPLGSLPAEVNALRCVSDGARLACLGDDRLAIFDVRG